MVGQEKSGSHGVVMGYDDLTVGNHYCVYSLRQTKESVPIMGQSFQVKAINLPFFVVQILTDPDLPIVTLDSRYLELMKVSDEFVTAQRESVQPKRVKK